MTYEEALRMVREICEAVNVPYATHLQIQQALLVIQEAAHADVQAN